MSEAKNSILILIERGSHMKEVWKPIIGYEGYYEVSNYGYVRTVTRFITNSGKHGMWYKSRLLKFNVDKDGYNTVALQRDGKVKRLKVHRLVLSTFNKDESDMQVNHIDGDKANNCLDNLEWVTSSQNIKHAYNIGLKTQVGAKNNSSKLSEQQVMQICDLFKNTTFTNKEIADMFHLKSDETVRRIRKRVSWTHITNNIEF